METEYSKEVDKMIKIQGFTLIELLFVLAIMGILAGVAVPSFSQQMKQDRLASNANQLQSVFKFARSEAAKRNQVIQLNENAGEWQVIINAGAENEQILHSFHSTHSSISVTGLADLTIGTTGEIQGVNNYIITDGDTDTTDYCLTILLSGQSWLRQDGSCSAP